MEEIRILCYGDSNTWGATPYTFNIRYPKNIRWTGVLQKKLGTGYIVVEEGYNSRTTVFDDPVEDRLSGLAYFGPCCVSQAPLDLIIIMLGSNDLKVRFGANAEVSAEGLQRYLDKLKILPMDGKKPEILVMAPPLVSDAYKKYPEFAGNLGTDAKERSEQFAEAYRKLADRNQVHFLNAADYAYPSEKDGVHLTEEGHQKLGCAVYEKVLQILKEREEKRREYGACI